MDRKSRNHFPAGAAIVKLFFGGEVQFRRRWTIGRFDGISREINRREYAPFAGQRQYLFRRSGIFEIASINIMVFEHQLENLLREDRPFILLVGCLADVPKAILTTLRQKKCVCLGLDDCVSISPDGSFSANGETVNLLNGIRSARQPMALTEYRCAPNTTWADVHIRKKDSDSVSIWVRGEAPVQINYLQLGLCNQVKGCPSHAFTALLALLSMPGKVLPLPARGTPEYDFWKRRKLDICIALRRFFPTINDGDPIEFVKNEGYRVRFVNRDDATNSSNDHPART